MPQFYSHHPADELRRTTQPRMSPRGSAVDTRELITIRMRVIQEARRPRGALLLFHYMVLSPRGKATFGDNSRESGGAS